MRLVRRIGYMTGIALLVLGCETPSDAPVEQPEQVVATDAEIQSGVVVEQEVPEETEPVNAGESEPIEVPEEVYNRAFEEVEAVIEGLNETIARGDYEGWTEYLTDRYREVYSDPEVLSELSRRPALAQRHVHLESLEDYFSLVVVPARVNLHLDDLIFYSDTLVEAVSVYRGEPATLYLLRKVDGAWRIDTF